MWFLDSGFKQLVSNSLNIRTNTGDAAGALSHKLARLRKALRKWNRLTFGNIFEHKKRLLEDAERFERRAEVGMLHIEEVEEWRQVREELQNV